MTAKLIISFDCEGKWGIADRNPDRQRLLTSAAISNAYKTILATLRRKNAHATFAFVAALCLPKDQVEAAIEENFHKLIFGRMHWLSAPRASARSNDFDGWSEPELPDLVRLEPRHHICSHGGFHIPYDEQNTPAEAIDADIDLIRSVDSRIGSRQTILVFPRNVIGYRNRLSESGFEAYRDADRRELKKGLAGRAERLFLELGSVDRGDSRKHSYQNNVGLTALTPGKFLNASIGLRSRIPLSLTKRRIDAFLSYAIKNDTVVHFYSHPHNFIADNTLANKLDYLLGRASVYRDKGSLRIVTMQDEFDEQK